MLILKQTTVEFDGINASPFCAKVELFLNYYQIPFKIEAALPMHGPHKKIPFVEYQGETIADSELILQRLIKDYSIDLGLTDPQLAQGRAWQQLLEQHLYWIIVYNRWIPEDSWEKLEGAFFSALKWPIRPIIAKQSRKLAKKNLYSQGIGRFSLEQVLHAGRADLKALSAHLSVNKYICGDTFSYFDLIAYATIKNINNQQMKIALTAVIQEFQSLLDHQSRIETVVKNQNANSQYSEMKRA
ncbi:MAG: glutathione S-transferase family protein [Psychromonas sp.]|nr:glutathione S-transferase family protein [Alteromonadales bacterium]MCP5079943.1 glutathione S-transferase family protein [Psychromonas sp.]